MLSEVNLSPHCLPHIPETVVRYARWPGTSPDWDGSAHLRAQPLEISGIYKVANYHFHIYYTKTSPYCALHYEATIERYSRMLCPTQDKVKSEMEQFSTMFFLLPPQ